MDIVGLTIDKLHGALKAGETSVEEVCTATLDRIEKLNPQLNTFITITRETALARARSLDAQLAGGSQPGPLFGVQRGQSRVGRGRLCLSHSCRKRKTGDGDE